jgi:hypothetical protein
MTHGHPRGRALIRRRGMVVGLHDMYRFDGWPGAGEGHS